MLCLKYNGIDTIYGSNDFEYYVEDECTSPQVKHIIDSQFTIFHGFTELPSTSSFLIFGDRVDKDINSSFDIINPVRSEYSSKFNITGVDKYILKEIYSSFLIESYDPFKYTVGCDFKSIEYLPENMREKPLYIELCNVIDYVICRYHYQNINYIDSIYNVTSQYYDAEKILTFLGSAFTIYKDLNDNQKATMTLILSNLFKIKGTLKALKYVLRLLNLDAEIYEWFEINKMRAQGDEKWGEDFEPCSIAIEATVNNFSYGDDLEYRLRELFSEFLLSCVKLAEFRWKYETEENLDISEFLDEAEFVIGNNFEETFKFKEFDISDVCPGLPMDTNIKVFTPPDLIVYNSEDAIYGNSEFAYYTQEEYDSYSSFDQSLSFYFSNDPDAAETVRYGLSMTNSEIDRITQLNNGVFPCDLSTIASADLSEESIEVNIDIEEVMGKNESVLYDGSKNYGDSNLYYSEDTLEVMSEEITIKIYDDDVINSFIKYNALDAIYGSNEFEYYTQDQFENMTEIIEL